MSTETSSKSHSKNKKEKSKKATQPGVSLERTKVVVRRLPPNLPESVFWQSVQSWVTDETVTWKIFCPGKFRKRLNKENIPSRAYIAFKREDQLATFAREYDGHLFRDKAGNESQAVVEFSPYQKVPSDKKKADARVGTIEKDEDYVSFLESLRSPAAQAEPPSMEALIAAAQPPPPPKTTPLLEALKAEKTAHRDKEVIQRNHAHYKETHQAPTAPKKDDSKKKSAPTATTSQLESVQLGKKAAKKAAAAQRAAAQAQTLANVEAWAAAAAGATASVTSGTSKGNAHSDSTPVPAVLPKQSPPKAPRAMREYQARQQANKAALAPDLSPALIQSNSNTATTTSGAPQPPAHASRRLRPVITNPTRQFEAALSGAGVAVAGSPGGDRKTRRERVRDKEKNKDRQNFEKNPDPTENNQGREKDDSVSGVVDTGGLPEATAPPSVSPKARVPLILQRPDPTPVSVLPQDEQSSTVSSLPDAGAPAPARNVLVVGGAPEAGPARGHGRRGRGRGRGGPSGRGGT